MSQKNYLFYFMFMGFSALILSFTSGCARYKARPLQALRIDVAEKQEAHVSLTYKVFDKSDCKAYLGRQVTKKGYQPVQVTINNNSGHYISFSPSNFSFPIISVGIVARKMHFLTAAYFFGYLFGGPLVWAGATIGVAGLSLMLFTRGLDGFWFAIFCVYCGAILIPLSLIPAFVAGRKSSRANHKLDRDYAYKTLCDQIIPPYSYLNGLVFVSKKDFKPDFSLTVTDKQTLIKYTLSTDEPCVDIVG